MADHIFPLNRRGFVAGLGAAVLGPSMPAAVRAAGRPPLALQAHVGAAALRPGLPETPIWSLGGSPATPELRFTCGETIDVTLANQLPVPMALNWRGIDGVPAIEPLTTRPPLAPGTMAMFPVQLRHAGTFLCDLRLLSDGQTQPSFARPLIVAENEAIAVDRNEVFLVEDWRLRKDGTAVAPGIDPRDATALYTVNGRTAPAISVRAHERLRFRFINGFQRNVIALKLEDQMVRVMALDGQPSEPFPARNNALVLPPGGRTDAFIDVTGTPGSTSSILLHDGKEARPVARLVVSNEPAIRDAPLAPAPPLPSNGLPVHLDLKNALRVDLALGGTQADWVPPTAFVASAQPAFRAKPGRTVVLALTNRGQIPDVFHLHGHHFRLLDSMDDGWKPFWLDTLAIEAGQTQHIAWLAEYPGRWLMESTATDWAAPRLVRWYEVG